MGVALPRVWVTSLRPGAYMRAFTPGSPAGPPPAWSVYIGRASPERAGSVLANPWRLRAEEERGATIARYAGWLAGHVAAGCGAVWDELLRLLRIAVDGGLVCACWCAPRSCHGDEVRRAIVAIHAAGWARITELEAENRVLRAALRGNKA